MPEAAPIRLDHLHAGDCLDVLRTLPDASVDLVFADPPYNLQLRQELRRPDTSRVDAVDAAWDRFESLEAYDAFTRAWLTECRRVLKDTGAIWVIGTYHNIYRVGAALQDLGFWFLNDVVWVKSNPMPQFRGVRFTNAHETLLWCAKHRDQKRYTFHYQALKAANDDRQMRSDWLLPLCGGTERLRADGAKVHPTQKPEALLYRVLLATTNPGDVVLDPFFGTGTTGVVARRLGRRWIGIERDPAYRAAAEARLAAVVPHADTTDPEVLGRLRTRRNAPRVPLARLLEEGWLAPGATLRFRGDPARPAVLLANGELKVGEARGSLHRVGAQLAGTPSCNGWDCWHVEVDGAWVVLDTVRERLRRRDAAAD